MRDGSMILERCDVTFRLRLAFIARAGKGLAAWLPDGFAGEDATAHSGECLKHVARKLAALLDFAADQACQ